MSLKDFAEKYIDENYDVEDLDREWERADKIESISEIIGEYLKNGIEKRQAVDEIIKTV